MAGTGANKVQLTYSKGISEVYVDGQRTLQKLHTQSNDAFDAMVASTSPIEASQSDRNGVSFVVSSSSSQIFMCGLASAAGGLHKDIANNVHYSSIAFAAYVCNGNFHVYEKGTGQGQYGHVQAGDTVKVALNEVTEKVEYSVNGQARYTSQLLPEFPLYVKCSAYHHGPLLEQLCWTSKTQPDRTMADQLEADLLVANAEIDTLRAQLRTMTVPVMPTEQPELVEGSAQARALRIIAEQKVKLDELQGLWNVTSPECGQRGDLVQALQDALRLMHKENRELKAKLAEAENEVWRSEDGLLSNGRRPIVPSKKRRVEQGPPDAKGQGVPAATTT